MVKQYYQILEVSENATQEQIKKSYRKLATKWHPDKWTTKSLAEKETANKKMQEINKAYEVLGDVEKKRKYDLGETDFSASGYNYEEELEELNRQKEEIDDELERTKEQSKIIARSQAITWIKLEISIRDLFDKHLKSLDKNLWSPYNCWEEKIMKMEIKSNPRGKAGINTSELDNFRDKMLLAVKEAKERYEAGAGVNNSELEQAKVSAVETIERNLKSKNLKVEDLEEKYHNYQEQINSLDKVWKIRSLRDKITTFIRRQEVNNVDRNIKIDKLGGENDKFEKGESAGGQPTIPKSNQNKPEKDKTSRGQDGMSPAQSNSDASGFLGDEYDNWTKDELIAKIKQLKAENKQEILNKKIEELEVENKKLREEIQELKKEKDNSPEFQAYLNQKESELQNKETRLEEIKNIVNSIQESKTKNTTDDNNFPTILIVSGISFIGLLSLVFLLKKNKKNRKKG